MGEVYRSCDTKLKREAALKVVPIRETTAEETDARFSPDGKWIVYQSNENGRAEIYVRPFPGPGVSVQVSTSGGREPQWVGKELFYIAANNHLTAVTLSLSGSKAVPVTSETLFALPPGVTNYATQNGQRFLYYKVTRDPSPITILQNWKPR